MAATDSFFSKSNQARILEAIARLDSGLGVEHELLEAEAVIISEERNAAFLGKLERGLAQVQAGQGIVKTMDELEAMAEDGKTLSDEML